MKKVSLLWAIFLLFGLACRWSASTSGPALLAGDLTRSLTHEGRERSYLLHVPERLDFSQPLAVVFVFHGGTGNAQNALQFSPCEPSSPISVLMLHGTADQHLPYDGGVGAKSLTGVNFASVGESVDFWTTFNGCNAQPQTESFADIQHQVWSGCREGTAVELYAILGGGHAWPGGNSSGRPGADQPTQTLSASQVIWEFFAAHPKP